MEKIEHSAVLRVASYNVRKARGLDQKRDPHRVLDVINQLSADVVAIQEADRRLGDRAAAIPRDLIDRETDFKVVPVADGDQSIGWHGNAVLVRYDLKVTSVKQLELSGLEPRGAVRVDIDAGIKTTVVATHLGLMRRHRRRQTSEIAKALESVDRPIIVGDFNEWRANFGLEAFVGRYEVHAPGRSFHASRPIAALDRLAITSASEIVNSGVEEGPIAKVASDHLPIWADIAHR